MTVIDEQGRPEPPLAAGEGETLLGFLEFHRATLEWRTRGLDSAGLNATLGPSTMTLGGMLKHLAYVEDKWFGCRLMGLPASTPWSAVDWAADPDWDWHSAAGDSPAELRSLWSESVVRSRAAVASAGTDLNRLSVGTLPDGSKVNFRWILVHLVEEYSRHNGHADLIRESIDGETGE